MDIALLLNILITLVIFGVIFWGINRIAAAITGVPGFVFVIIQVVAVIFLVVYLLKLLGLLAGVAVLH